MQARISTLLQGFQVLVPQLLGVRFVLTSGDRDCLKQLEISGPQSYHVVGLAFDGVVQPYDARLQKLLGDAAVQLGFRWGGNFKSADVVHFDDGNRGAAGRCATNSGASIIDSLAAILAAFSFRDGPQGISPNSGITVSQAGGVPNGSNQTGSSESPTICAPERAADGRTLTGRVTCEPYNFGPSGFDSY